MHLKDNLYALYTAQARSHPGAHRVTRAIDVNKSLELERVSSDSQANDIFMLCSDGLSSVLTDDEIALILQNRRAEHLAHEMIQEALAHNTPDNVTVITVQYLGFPTGEVDPG